MDEDELDRALLAEDEIVPSSGFSSSVMAAVRTVASAPPPLPFPWRRAWPGFIAVAITCVALLVTIVSESRAPDTTVSSSFRLPDLDGLLAAVTAPSVLLSTTATVIALVTASIGKRLGYGRASRL